MRFWIDSNLRNVVSPARHFCDTPKRRTFRFDWTDWRLPTTVYSAMRWEREQRKKHEEKIEMTQCCQLRNIECAQRCVKCDTAIWIQYLNLFVVQRSLFVVGKIKVFRQSSTVSLFESRIARSLNDGRNLFRARIGILGQSKINHTKHFPLRSQYMLSNFGSAAVDFGFACEEFPHHTNRTQFHKTERHRFRIVFV